MIKKELVDGRAIIEVESDLLEVETLVRESLKSAKQIKSIYSTKMDGRGMSIQSSNIVCIETIDVTHFNDCLVINVNNLKFSIAINNKCNIIIQRPEPGIQCKLYFKDFEMWLVLM